MACTCFSLYPFSSLTKYSHLCSFATVQHSEILSYKGCFPAGLCLWGNHDSLPWRKLSKHRKTVDPSNIFLINYHLRQNKNGAAKRLLNNIKSNMTCIHNKLFVNGIRKKLLFFFQSLHNSFQLVIHRTTFLIPINISYLATLWDIMSYTFVYLSDLYNFFIIKVGSEKNIGNVLYAVSHGRQSHCSHFF